MANKKVIVCGAGFLGSYIARQLVQNNQNIVHLASRTPYPLHDRIAHESRTDASLLSTRLGAPLRVDVTKPDTLRSAFESANTIISLVGVLHGTPRQFEEVQFKGAQNVARAAREAGARLIHVSAIGADPTSSIPYFRTKGLAELSVHKEVPEALVVRPSLVFGPGDGFFAGFATLSRFLPFLPVFGGGMTRFQPVYAGDIARFIDFANRTDSEISRHTTGRIIEAGGPEVFTYRQMMELVLRYTGRKRSIVSLPFAAGKVQGFVLEKLPTNILTITRDQVEQLKSDNVARDSTFSDLLVQGDGTAPTSVHRVLPTYL